MAEADIPVDLFNPGQVFACLGFLEAADILLGDAEGGFNWSNEDDVRFRLRAGGEINPFKAVLDFLKDTEIIVLAPKGVDGPWPDNSRPSSSFPASPKVLKKSDGKGYSITTLPIILQGKDRCIPVSHWMKRGNMETLKLFAGQQVAYVLMQNMFFGDSKRKETKGIMAINDNTTLFRDPFSAICPVSGRFGFDARGGWDSMRIGISLDKLSISVSISPYVEILAPIGLENACPIFYTNYNIGYATWSAMLPIVLCRIAIFNPSSIMSRHEFRSFSAHLGDDKQYKKIFFSKEEN